MKFIKAHLYDILVYLIEIIVGILLIANPVSFTAFIIKGLGLLLLVLGVFHVIRYFRKEAAVAAASPYLFHGLLYAMVGLFLLLGTGWFMTAFPVMAVIFGIAQIVLGLHKAQVAVDALRLGFSFWLFPCVGAILSVICGMVIVMNPAMTVISIWIFTGLSLMIIGVFDLVSLFFTKKPAEA